MRIRNFALLTLVIALGLAFTYADKSTAPNISGTWKLESDKNIDGKIGPGNLGCSEIQFKQNGDTFKGNYTKCQPASKNALPSKFAGKIYSSSRGILIHMHQDNYASTKYYAAWAGQLIDSEVIEGIWTDVEGNRGEFRLTR